MTATKTVAELKIAIQELSARTVLVETNEGTYGAVEACRACGTGDPAFATRRVYETVGTGERTYHGPDLAKAPGHTRYMGRDELADLRRELADLRAELKRARA